MRPNIWFWVTPEQIGILSTRDCYGVALDLPKGSFFSSYIAKPGDCHHWYQCIQINCKKLKDCFSRWLWCLKNQRSKYQNVIMPSIVNTCSGVGKILSRRSDCQWRLQWGWQQSPAEGDWSNTLLSTGEDPDVLHEYASDYWQKFFPPSKYPPAGQLPPNLWGS